MVVCEHCQSKNSLDSQFCKSCGREVNESARKNAREENAKLVAEGYVMLGESRTDEAALLARAVLEADPSNAGGYSLQGMVAERMGDLVGALESYEHVLALNPDSTLDKIKVQQLRQALTRQIGAEPKPNRRAAFAAAAASVVFMATAGAIVATMMTRPAQAAEQPAGDQQIKSEAATPFVGSPMTVAKNNATQNPGEVQPVREEQPVTNNPGVRGGGVSQGGQPTFRYRPPENVRSIPGVGNGSAQNQEDPETGPLRIEPELVNQYTGPRDPNEPAAEGTRPSNPGTGTAPTQPERKAIIEITRRGEGEKVGGSESIGGPDQNGAEAAVRTAQQQQMSGNAKGAASSLERARQMGRDDGAVNQRLGSVYAQNGEKDKAIAAYQRAAQKLEAEVKSGKAGAKEKLESTKQALKNLQGKGG